MRQQSRGLSIFLRLVAALLVLAAGAAAFLPPDILATIPQAPAWLMLGLSIAVAAALLALARLAERKVEAPPEVIGTLTRVSQQITDLGVKLSELELLVERNSHQTHASPIIGMVPKDYTAQLEQLTTALAEVRAISLLPDSDRRQLAHLHREQRKATAVKDLFGLVAAHEWSKAERLLITLETEFPNDGEVARGRSYLDHSRNLFEGETIQKATHEVEELMLSASWDKAVERVHELVQGFPGSAQSRTLCMRVEREYTIYVEATVQRLFDDLRHCIEVRRWREALSLAERLLQQFPQHRRAEQVRGQMRLLRENAEIEQRQEMEVRFQEYVHDGRFDEALELGESMMRKFPMSPQADSLETLLPKIREMAQQGIHEFSGLSPDVADSFAAHVQNVQDTVIRQPMISTTLQGQTNDNPR